MRMNSMPAVDHNTANPQNGKFIKNFRKFMSNVSNVKIKDTPRNADISSAMIEAQMHNV